MGLQINRQIKSHWIPEALARQWQAPSSERSKLLTEVRLELQKYDQNIPRDQYFIAKFLQAKVPIVNAIYNMPDLLANPHFVHAMAYEKFVSLDYIAECASKRSWTQRENLPQDMGKNLSRAEISLATNNEPIYLLRISREIKNDKHGSEYHRLSINHENLEGISINIDVYSPGAFNRVR